MKTTMLMMLLLSLGYAGFMIYDSRTRAQSLPMPDLAFSFIHSSYISIMYFIHLFIISFPLYMHITLVCYSAMYFMIDLLDLLFLDVRHAEPSRKAEQAHHIFAIGASWTVLYILLTTGMQHADFFALAWLSEGSTPFLNANIAMDRTHQQASPAFQLLSICLYLLLRPVLMTYITWTAYQTFSFQYLFMIPITALNYYWSYKLCCRIKRNFVTTH